MNARTEERVGGWDSRSFSRGHAGLRDLADEEFSGVVEADGGAWLCMLNGKVVGVFEGTIDDFADAAGTAHVAPDPALPLLFAMEEIGGTLEEQYYTKDTPISEADGTLTSGGFTGYVELSENVLSGDYYVCYYGGRSMSVAFVGSSERLMTGDEAFERADDEVGIYDVYSVDVEVAEIPDPEGDAAAGATAGGAAGARSEEPVRGEGERTTAGGRDADRGHRTEAGRGDDPIASGGTGGDPQSGDRTAGTDRTTADRGTGRSQSGDATEGRAGADGRDRARSDDRERPGTGDRERSGAAGGRGRSGSGDRSRSEPGDRERSGGRDRDDGRSGVGDRDDGRSGAAEGPADRSGAGERGGSAGDPDPAESRTGGGAGRSGGGTRDGGTLDSDNPLGDLSEQLQEVESRNATLDDPATGTGGSDATGGSESTGGSSDADAAEGSRETPDRGAAGSAGDTGDPLAGADDDRSGAAEDRSRAGGAGPDPADDAAEGYGRESEEPGAYRGDPEAADPAGGRRGPGDGTDGPDRRAAGEPAGRGDDAGRDPARDERPRREPDDDRNGRSRAGTDRDRAGSPREGRTGDAGRPRREREPEDRAEPGGPTRSSGDGAADRGRGRADDAGPERRDAGAEAGDPPDGRRFEDEAAWREDRSVPSIADDEGSEELLEELREGLHEREAEIDRLRDRVEELEADRDAGETDRERLQSEIEELGNDLGELRRTVLRLDKDIERLEAGAAEPSAEAAASGGGANGATGGGAAAEETRGPDLTPAQALAGTKLLVRYGSQGKPTLKTAHGGGADRQAVNDNLRLDVHTEFPDGATVEGRPFEEFLDARMEYGFVEWLVRDLPFEVRETGNDAALQDLYDAVPRIDRVELAGEVTIEYLNDEERDPEHVEFDVVARDDREQPLVVANFDDSGDPATQGMVVELNDRAERIRDAGPLNAAFLVTSSYFDGQARDTASEATSGSFLSRDSRKSFVNVSRKRGYHLCLVESRDGDFHVRVPEL